jgi:hypothetical protein
LILDQKSRITLAVCLQAHLGSKPVGRQRNVTNVIEFVLGQIGGNERFSPSLTVTPHIDGVALSSLITAFEFECSYQPAGGYGGLIPSGFQYGPLDQYFLGRPAKPDYWQEIGGFYVLGCLSCGQVGCWPLVCKISTADQHVIWREFRQPHRPKRDYSTFGSFTFGRAEYEASASALASAISGDP